jgi:signal transduction histidine kinase
LQQLRLSFPFAHTEVLLGVVEDLAFATMFETGKLTPLNLKPIHIASMLAEVLEAAYATDERGNVKDLLRLSIRCSNRVPPVVCADSSLQRILFNLVSNAMQFCSEKGEVSLAVHFSQPKPTTNVVPQPLSGEHPIPYPVLLLGVLSRHERSLS